VALCHRKVANVFKTNATSQELLTVRSFVGDDQSRSSREAPSIPEQLSRIWDQVGKTLPAIDWDKVGKTPPAVIGSDC
jgi:hypothetical protein